MREQSNNDVPFWSKGEFLTADKLNQLSKAVLARTPLPGAGTRIFTSPSGFNYSSDSGTSTTNPFLVGFKLHAVNTSEDETPNYELGITPSVVTGLGSALFAYIGNTDLRATNKPTLTISGETDIFLKAEILPEPKAVAGTGTGEDNPTVYEVDDNSFTVVGNKVTVVTSNEDETRPSVNANTGAVESNGLIYIPLGRVNGNSEGITIQYQYMYGPIATKLCNGGLIIYPPVIVHTGSIVEPTA